ncbi:MAG: DUF951 domain-containing protein [Clostridiales bacterium]|nr:DUF951 domain-containing protein [Clostridiales bacterium]
MIESFELGDIITMKKQHPCGSFDFEVIRVGADVKIKCTGCGRIVMIPRSKFVRLAKKIINKE